MRAREVQRKDSGNRQGHTRKTIADFMADRTSASGAVSIFDANVMHFLMMCKQEIRHQAQ
jgi:hypothetical protein